MVFYARPSWRLVRQIVADLFVVVWGIGWWLVGRVTDGVIRALAEPARQASHIGADLRRQLTDAAVQANGVPLVGRELRRPFDAMAGSADAIVTTAQQQIAAIEQAATFTGWLTFAIPTAIILVLWLPRRIAFARRSGQIRALLTAGDGEQLLALRALATQPLANLRSVGPDPVAGWRAGDPAVIAALAELELIRAGASRPRRRSRRPSTLVE